MFSKQRTALAVLLLVSFTGCQKKATEPPNRRLVIQSIEAQSELPRAAELAATASEAYFWRRLSLAYSAQDEEQVRQSGAALVLRGQLRPAGAGKWQLSAQLVNQASHEWLGTLEEVLPEAGFLEQACAAFDRLLAPYQLAAAPQAPPCTPEESWLALRKGVGEWEALVARDPLFLPAVLRLGQHYALENQLAPFAQLQAKLEPVKPGTRQAYAAGQLALLRARTPAERLAALEQILSVRSEDAALHREAAELAQAAGAWPRALDFWKRLTTLAEARPLDFNSLAYAAAQNGQTDEAIAAARRYQQLAPQEANPLDTLGEVQYMGRRFAQAAVSFDELHQQHPDFQNRHGLYKAAVAWYRAGKVAEADQRHQAWLAKFQGKRNPTMQAFQRAYWLARTGRAQQGLDLLAKAAPPADLYRAILLFGLTRQAPPQSQFVAWSKQLTDPQTRQDFAIFGLLSSNAGSAEAWRQRIAQAVGNGPAVAIAARLIETGLAVWEPSPAPAAIEPLVEGPPGVLEAMLVRYRDCKSGLPCQANVVLK
ncbi:MAG: hypothetical protein NW208_08360 [Bryobacter sp.]|nr:hypothetical protein [Bryobacter sp.]